MRNSRFSAREIFRALAAIDEKAIKNQQYYEQMRAAYVSLLVDLGIDTNFVDSEHRFIAFLQPQVWEYDYAVDNGRVECLDVTEQYIKLHPYERAILHELHYNHIYEDLHYQLIGKEYQYLLTGGPSTETTFVINIDSEEHAKFHQQTK